jgi:hypothetical protein
MKLNLKQSIKVWFQINVMSLFYFGYSSKADKKENNLDDKNSLQFISQGRVASPENESSTTIIVSAGTDTASTKTLIESLRQQSIKPTAIWVVCHTNKDKTFYDHSSLADAVWVTNSDVLGWDKAAITQLITTEYVVWIESFMKPSQCWLACCIAQFKAEVGIYGAKGVIRADKEQDLDEYALGWDGIASDKNQHVDFVQDALFFSKELFSELSSSLFNLKGYKHSPEYMLCYLAAKQSSICSFVLPYTESNKDTWSTDKRYSLPLSRKAFSFELFQAKLNTLKNTELVGSQTTVEFQHQKATPEHRGFYEELFFFTDKILSHENFSIVRFGDGEMKIVKGESIKTSRFFYTPGDNKHEHNRDILCKSLSYNNLQYYVGFPGRCCVGDQYTDSIIELSGLPDKQLTWASVFINANYDDFLNITVPALQKRTLNLICFEKAVLKHLPFKIKKQFGVGMNAWADDLETTLPAIEAYIEEENVKDEVFIFCSGILSNMLIYKLTEKYPQNTYLDVGSVFDVYLSLGKTRRYLKGNQKQIQHSCTW